MYMFRWQRAAMLGLWGVFIGVLLVVTGQYSESKHALLIGIAYLMIEAQPYFQPTIDRIVHWLREDIDR